MRNPCPRIPWRPARSRPRWPGLDPRRRDGVYSRVPRRLRPHAGARTIPQRRPSASRRAAQTSFSPPRGVRNPARLLRLRRPRVGWPPFRKRMTSGSRSSATRFSLSASRTNDSERRAVSKEARRTINRQNIGSSRHPLSLSLKDALSPVGDRFRPCPSRSPYPARRPRRRAIPQSSSRRARPPPPAAFSQDSELVPTSSITSMDADLRSSVEKAEGMGQGGSRGSCRWVCSSKVLGARGPKRRYSFPSFNAI